VLFKLKFQTSPSWLLIEAQLPSPSVGAGGACLRV
jgi:hypothetical protein